MPKIAQFPDLHIRYDNRFDEALRCLDFAIEDAISQKVDLFALTGDTFDTKSTPVERNAFAARVRRMASHCPVVIIRGNHDKPGDLEIFSQLETENPVAVFEIPGIVILGDVHVYAFPHFDRSNATSILPADLATEESDQAMANAIRIILQHWKGKILESDSFRKSMDEEVELFSDAHLADFPSIFLGHLTIAGSILSNGETHPGHGIQLSIGDLDTIGFDAVMLGHIHQEQTCDAAGRIRYAGSIFRSNFGEEAGRKGYLLWDIPARGEDPKVEFREIPARRMITLQADFDGDRIVSCTVPPETWEVKDAEIRIRITVPEDRRATAEGYKQECDALFRGMGAYDVQIEIRTIPVTRVRSEEIATAQTLEDKLKAYHIATEAPPEGDLEEIFAKLKEVELEVA